jgi:hypothetical protein
MSHKAYIQYALLVIYLPVMVFVNAPVIICLPDGGDVQIEFCSIACDLNTFQGASSTEIGNCGECTDFKPTIGDTPRIAFGNKINIPLIKNTIFCQAVEQKTSRISCHIEPNISASDLIGSSIIVI